MPQPALERFDQRAVVMAPAGTPLVNATHGLMLRDGESSVTADPIEQNVDTPYLGAKPKAMSNFRATIAGSLGLQPPAQPGHATRGIVPVALDAGLKACGLARTLDGVNHITRYSPVSSEFAAADAIFYHAGEYLDTESIRGDLSNVRMEIGQPYDARASWEGGYETLAEAELPTDIDLGEYDKSPLVCEPENTDLVVSASDGTITDLHLWGRSMIANLGHQVQTTRFTEHRETGINARNGSVTLQFARPDYSEFNPDVLFRSRAFLTAKWRLKYPTGIYSALVCRMQVDQHGAQDIDSNMGKQVQGALVPSDSGNDEVYIEYGYWRFAVIGSLPATAVQDAVFDDAEGISVAGPYVGAVTYTITAGALPTGLSITAGTGAITGTPTVLGEFTFTVTATDSTGGTPLTATRSFTIEVVEA